MERHAIFLDGTPELKRELAQAEGNSEITNNNHLARESYHAVGVSFVSDTKPYPLAAALCHSASKNDEGGALVAELASAREHGLV